MSLINPMQSAASSSVLDWREVALKLLKWIMFEVIFALMPLAFNWASAELKHKNAGWEEILGRGELLLVAVAIVAAGLGDLSNRGMNNRLRGTKQTLIGVGCILICASTWLYSQVAVLPGEANSVDLGAVVVISLAVAPSAMFLSLVCSIAAEVK